MADFTKALDRINEVVTNAPQAALKAAGEAAITIITLRTKKGLDASGDPFKPYVKPYAMRRLKRGLRSTPPDLTVTGHMLGSMTPAVTGENEVTIEFNGALEIAKAAGNSRYRDFFDVRLDAELEIIADAIGDGLIAEILK